MFFTIFGFFEKFIKKVGQKLGNSNVGAKTLSDLINTYQTSPSPILAVIYEPFLAWALDVAKDFGLFAAAFFTHAYAVDYLFYNVYHEVLKMPVCSNLQIGPSTFFFCKF